MAGLIQLEYGQTPYQEVLSMAQTDRVPVDREAANLLRQIAHELSAKTGERVTLSDTLRMLVKNYRESQSVLTSFGLGGSQ